MDEFFKYTNIDSRGFTLGTLEEVREFDRLLDEYALRVVRTGSSCFSLAEVYKYFDGDSKQSKVLYVFLDVKINFILLHHDMCEFCYLLNKILAVTGAEMQSDVLRQPEFFNLKMETHRNLSSYILRYRALWDKIMGALVILHDEKKYEKFQSARSKRKYFSNFCESSTTLSNMGPVIVSVISDFDRFFRTAEAHGAGVLRKYSFLVEAPNKNPQIELVRFWNRMLVIVEALLGVFEGKQTKATVTF